ncbi:MAG TPA: hypothetical protein VN181_02515 [Thermoanaerobaculia bacterium]|nr:hypothetical protein [Thermoanaerobaculia bacterium]
MSRVEEMRRKKAAREGGAYKAKFAPKPPPPLYLENALAWEIGLAMVAGRQVVTDFGQIVCFRYEALQALAWFYGVPRTRRREVLEKFQLIEPILIDVLKGKGKDSQGQQGDGRDESNTGAASRRKGRRVDRR